MDKLCWAWTGHRSAGLGLGTDLHGKPKLCWLLWKLVERHGPETHPLSQHFSTAQGDDPSSLDKSQVFCGIGHLSVVWAQSTLPLSWTSVPSSECDEPTDNLDKWANPCTKHQLSLVTKSWSLWFACYKLSLQLSSNPTQTVGGFDWTGFDDTTADTQLRTEHVALIMYLYWPLTGPQVLVPSRSKSPAQTQKKETATPHL